MPTSPATRTTARSPWWCIIRVNPVGANASGSADGRPSTIAVVSTAVTSRRTRGRNSTPWNASRARRRLVSASAAPSV
jgi:hypothetical protein